MDLVKYNLTTGPETGVHYTPSPSPPGGTAAQLVVSRYDSTQDTGFFRVIPNVECLQIQVGDGANPGAARFRYRFGDPLNPRWPDRIEDVFGLNVKAGPYVLAVDEEIVVTKIDPPTQDSQQVQYTILFHGTCQVPQGDVAGDTESVTFQAVGIAMRCWEAPVGGAVMRSGPDLTIDDGSADVPTGRDTRFNPDGLANATALGFWSGGDDGADEDEDQDGGEEGDDGADDEGDGKGGDSDDDDEEGADGPTDALYPVFLDTPEDGIRDRKYFQLWTLSMAARYLLSVYNEGEDFVQNPSFASLTSLLDSFEVKPGMDFDPTDPTTYTEDPITVEDYDATGDPWPVAIEKLISPYGFGYRFRLDEDDDGKPETRLEFYRTDAADGAGPKNVFLAPAGSGYDPGSSNAEGLAIHRDVSGVFNQVELDTELIRHEVSLVLAPGPWTILAGDVANVEEFTIGNPEFAGEALVAYRTFVFDEDGAGHNDRMAGEIVTGKATNMDSIFGKPKPDPDNPNGPPVPSYAKRPRKPIGTLFSRQALDGDRYRAQLHVSKNPGSNPPYVWDGGGDWQLVDPGTWELLPNRLGILITVKNPNDDFNVGAPPPKPAGGPAISYASDGGGKINLIEAFATPNADHPTPTFRLTCVVESDQPMGIVAKRRNASTSPRTIVRSVDTRDRFVLHVIDSSSYLNTKGKGYDVIDEDDTKAAQAYADAIREANECAPLNGTVTIPRLTLAYNVGDPIKGVYGRNVSFRINQGAPAKEAAQYPVVSGITFSFGDQERTTLQLTTPQRRPPSERRR